MTLSYDDLEDDESGWQSIGWLGTLILLAFALVALALAYALDGLEAIQRAIAGDANPGPYRQVR